MQMAKYRTLSKLEFWNMMTDYLKYNIFPLCGYSYLFVLLFAYDCDLPLFVYIVLS